MTQHGEIYCLPLEKPWSLSGMPVITHRSFPDDWLAQFSLTNMHKMFCIYYQSIVFNVSHYRKMIHFNCKASIYQFNVVDVSFLLDGVLPS
jgi:hypothetical protein